MINTFFCRVVLLLTGMGLSHIASAAYFSSYIYEMGSDESFISKPVQNDTSTLNLYTVQSFKIDKPGENGENMVYAKERELIFTPLSLQINPKSTDFFKLLYIGPKDDQERYYRVVFSEVPFSAFEEGVTPQATTFVPKVSMSTIMVVRPRKQKLQYVIDEKEGVIKNTGNTFFRVIIHKSCKLDDESSTQFYMLPDEEFRHDIVKQKNQKFIVANKSYTMISQQCEQENNKALLATTEETQETKQSVEEQKHSVE
ncbi:fimbria/pilus periplasmic chaperone [Acinetobacter rudis]|nr:fimbria/pilus periplasmic chaperone [Acinetobacter rudis]